MLRTVLTDDSPRGRRRLMLCSVGLLIFGMVMIGFSISVALFGIHHATEATATQLHPPAPRTYPTACAHPGYCDPDVDSICTIIAAGQRYGTDQADLVNALRPTAHRYRSSDFDACPQYRPLWQQALS